MHTHHVYMYMYMYTCKSHGGGHITAVSAQRRIPSNVPRPFPVLGVWSGHETTPSLGLHPPPSLTQGSARCSNGEVWLESGGGSSLLRLPHSHACLLPSHPSHCSRGPHALLAQNIAPDFLFVAKLRGLIKVAQTQSIIPIISSLSISISTLPMLLCTRTLLCHLTSFPVHQLRYTYMYVLMIACVTTTQVSQAVSVSKPLPSTRGWGLEKGEELGNKATCFVCCIMCVCLLLTVVTHSNNMYTKFEFT